MENSLMAPKYKVVADYPGCPFDVGVILTVAQDGEMYSINHGYAPSDKIIRINEIEKWPHLFQVQGWWEGLTEEEMPKYLKIVITNNPSEYGFVFRVDRYEQYFVADAEIPNDSYLAYSDKIRDCIPVVFCNPATSEEYEELKFSSQKDKETPK